MSYNEVLDDTLSCLVDVVHVVSFLSGPLTRWFRHLLHASSFAVGVREASVLIRDGSEGDLRFLAATGEAVEQLVKMKVPAGKGIAGFVMSSGQPMAVSNVEEEPNFYAEVDRATGFS